MRPVLEAKLFIIDDIINAIGAANASAAQGKSIDSAMGLQRDVYNQQRADQQPWLQAGMTSLADLMRLTQDPSALNASPAYQFRMDEGQKALERSAAARGGLNSGGFMKSLARYSQGVASDEYGNQWNRLAQLSGMGQNSAQNLGGLGSNYANSMSNLYGAQGNANAAGAMGVANGVASGVRSLGNLATLGLGGGFSGLIPKQGMGAYGAANPATTMINPASMPNPFG